jgi:hypothetical protein
MVTYQPDFDLDFQRGLVGENLVGTFLQALEGGRIEVKTDYRVAETGNVYVETWQYRLPDASDRKPSGINTSKAEFWAFASPDGQGFICVTSEALKNAIRDHEPREVRQSVSGPATNASIGRIVPIPTLLRAIGLYKEEQA